MGCDAGKHVFGVSDKVRFKPAFSDTEASLKIEISLVASLDIVFFNKGITKALIRLRGCWSQTSSRRGPYDINLMRQ